MKRVQHFSLLRPLALLMLLGALSTARAATFTVSNTADSGVGSLRQAIIDANTATGLDTIAFAIPGDGPHTISPVTALPDLTDMVTIDGYTQGDSTVTTTDDAVENTNASGGLNTVLKIELNGASIVGGTGLHPVAGSTGSTVRGLCISGFTLALRLDAGLITITGCFLGTDPTGTLARGNGNGISTNAASGSSRIGGATPAERNLISGNTTGISCFFGPGLIIQGNLIGTDSSGTANLGNSANGIGGNDITNCRIGGTGAGESNVIAFNGGAGVGFFSFTIPAIGNSILSNSIHSNGGLGIDLGFPGGVTPNDDNPPFDTPPPPDTDSGPNNLQNFPVLSSVTFSGGNTTVQGVLRSAPSTTFRIEFFANAVADATGNGEGQLFLGATSVTTDTNGNATINAVLPVTPPLGQRVISSTATDPDNNTSEFSAVVEAADSCSVVVRNTNNSGPDSLREAINCSNATPGTQTISFAIPGSDVQTITPISALPEITDAVVIDGYTQSGAMPNTNPVGQGLNGVLKIVLDGSGYTSVDRILQINSGGSTIRGLVINRYRFGAIRFQSADGNTVEGCYLGTDASGTTGLTSVAGSSADAISTFLGSDNNLIGGTVPAARNLISGNLVGIRLQDDNNRVLGNLIGTNASGTASIANAIGVSIDFGTGNIIGAPNAGNIIAGSVVTPGSVTGNGIVVGSNDNVISSNFIGTNVSGSAALPNALNGILIQGTASNNTIGGATAAARNLISGNTGSGVLINGQGFAGGAPPAQNNRVQGNYIGTNAAGTAALANGGEGVEIYNSSNNTVGGTTATTGQAPGNLISGNGGVGVEIATGGSPPVIGPSNNNIVRGNLIGTNLSGTAAIPNGESGVLIEDDSSSNSIGGIDAGAGNVISGNAQNGIALLSENGTEVPSNNLIQGNRIGTNLAGTAAIANGGDGVSVSVARGTVIGGAVAARNLISGNTRYGIQLSDAAQGSTIQRNFIGTQADGATALGNGSHGILAIGSGANTIGNSLGNPADVDAGNVIAFNGGDGVAVVFANGQSFFKGILGNSIHSNAGLGIDLEDNGVTPNDAGDADIGANDLQNYPVLTLANSASSSTTVRGTLNSKANTEYRIELFTNDVADPTGFGEGRTFVAFQNATSDSAGNLNFTFPVAADLSGQFLTATATDPSGNTSEFSRALAVSPGPAISIADAAPVTEGDSGQANAATFTVSLASPSPQEVRVTYETQSGTATEGVDFVRKAELLIFASGETSKTITVPIIGDTIAEGNETFKVQLSTPVNATLNPSASAGTGTILDDETAALTLSITPTTFSEAAGATAATGTVSRNTATATALTVNLLSSNVDKVTVPASVEIPAGQTSVQFALSAVDNSVVDGSKTVTITASRAGLTSATADVTVTDNDTTPGNTPPTANNQSLRTPKNTPLKIVLSGSDAETPAANLTFRLVTRPTNGTLSGTALNLTYTPNTDFVGADSFTFVANDGTADSPPATISIAVGTPNTAPVANNQNLSTRQNTPLTFALTATDADGDTLTFRLVTWPTNGTLSGNAARLVYTPNTDFVGTDSLTFVANDGTVDSNTATITLQVLAVAPTNTPPVAKDQTLRTPQNTPVTFALTATDADVPAQTLTFRLASRPRNGTLSGNAARLTYTPNNGFTGSDSFTFIANDGTADSNVGTIMLQVLAGGDGENRAPVAQNLGLRVDKSTPKSFTLRASDPDGDALTFFVGRDIPGSTDPADKGIAPRFGTLSGTAPNLTYTPRADFVGRDVFTFYVSDGKTTSKQARVEILVTAQTLISAANDSYNLIYGAPEQMQNTGVTLLDNGVFRITAPGVLANDRGREGVALSAKLAQNPRNGRIQLNANGSFDYQPSSGFAGTDEFAYTLSDGTNTANARVRLIVIDRRPPELRFDEPELRFDTPANGSTVKTVSEIRGRVRDKNAGLKSISLLWRREADGAFWNGSEWVREATPLPLTVTGIVWSYEGDLPENGTNRETDLLDGAYKLRVTAVDNSGNTGRLTNNIVVDNSAPEVPEFSQVRLSSAGASAALGGIALRFTGALDVASASDTMNYVIAINGVETEIGEVNYASNVVTLSGFDLQEGDEIELFIEGLRDVEGKALRGGTIQLVAR